MGVTTGAHQTEGNNLASDWWASELTPVLGAGVERVETINEPNIFASLASLLAPGFTAEVLDSLRAALDDGVDVRGYLHWSLLDNYEWGTYRPTLGLIAVDRVSFRRTPKPSLAWLGAQRP